MRNIRLRIEYDGTDFSGWQLQAGEQRTVQGEIERRLRAMTSEPTRLRGAGRTDAGVHAAGQVANFYTESRIPPLGFLRGANALLPRDAAILDAAEVEPSFDARRDARGKHYRYRIWNHEVRSALRERYAWWVRPALDVQRMAAAASVLLGTHDFAGFRAADCERTNTVRQLRHCEVSRDGDEIRIDVEATAFLKNMVRIIVGTLVAAGRGKLSAADVRHVLEAKDRTAAGMTAPPQGLTLVEVFYGIPWVVDGGGR